MENITPAKRALATLDKPPPAEIPAAARRISKKVTAAIDLMVSGEKKICDAAEKVGLARESLSRALSKPHVAEHLRQKVLRHLAMAAARAGAVKIDLMAGRASPHHFFAFSPSSTSRRMASQRVTS